MLAGGETPLAAYRALARQSLPHGEGLHILFSDERYVPADSADSNYHRARPLLDALGLAPAAIARVRTGLSLEEAAGDYERQIAALLGTGVRVRLGDGLAAVSVTPQFLAQLEEPLFVVAGREKHAVLARLAAQDPQLTAWRAVASCARVELWMEDGAQD